MARGRRRLPFRYCEPVCFAGLLDDPVLFLRIRPLQQAVLFDCGQIAHLAKRVIKPITAVFVSHAHMDHLMGLPTMVRHHHASPRPLDLYGPPGIADRVHHLLSGFEWNLTEPTWFTLRVHEVHESCIRHYRYPGPEGFARHFDGEEERPSRVIWSCRYLKVEAEILDHRLPVLAFRASECPHFVIDPDRLEQAGLVSGKWLQDLKTHVWKGEPQQKVTVVRRAGETVVTELCDDPEGLYERIKGEGQGASLGYLTDVGWTETNRQVMERFLSGLTLLCAECTFLREDVEKARASYHLTTADINELTERIKPGWLLVMHLSKSYLHHPADLYRQLNPPLGTEVLPLPTHIVPAPLGVEQVDHWLRPRKVVEKQPSRRRPLKPPRAT